MSPKSYVVFMVWFVGLTFGLPVVLGLIREVSGVNLSSSAVSIIPIMLASMLAGMRYVRLNQFMPEGGEMWQITLRLTALALAFNLVVVLGLMAIAPEVTGQLTLAIVFVVAVGAFVLFWLLSRLFFRLGARNQMKLVRSE